jgi:flagellar hook-basal body complex protein FliE
MSSREEYLEKFKTKIDEWDADIDKLEAKARDAQADAQAQYHKQIESMREMRNEAMTRYSEMQNAAADAWEAMAKGGEKAWNAWLAAFDEARSKFTSGKKG